jgi:hypothetical protein
MLLPADDPEQEMPHETGGSTFRGGTIAKPSGRNQTCRPGVPGAEKDRLGLDYLPGGARYDAQDSVRRGEVRYGRSDACRASRLHHLCETTNVPEPREYVEKRGALERLLQRLPGFRGYLEKENRRDSDRLLRSWLADRLFRSKQGLESLARGLLAAGDLKTLPQCDMLRGQLDAVTARLRGAVPGYSGMFDLVQIDEQKLDQVYDYDFGLIKQVDAVAGLVENLPAQQASALGALRDVGEHVTALNKAIEARDDLLKGLE